MKNPTWDNSRPRGEEDAATEIDRLTREIRQTLDSIGQTQEQTARSREATERNLQWIREHLHAGKTR